MVDRAPPGRQVRLGQLEQFGRVDEPTQVSLDQTGTTVADQQRLEDAVAAHCGEVVGVQQWRSAGCTSPSSVTITPVMDQKTLAAIARAAKPVAAGRRQMTGRRSQGRRAGRSGSPPIRPSCGPVELTCVCSSCPRNRPRRRRHLALRRSAGRAALRRNRCRSGRSVASRCAHADRRRPPDLAAQHLHAARQRTSRRREHAEPQPRRAGPGRGPLDPDRARRRQLSRHRAVAQRAAAGLPAQRWCSGRR